MRGPHTDKATSIRCAVIASIWQRLDVTAAISLRQSAPAPSVSRFRFKRDDAQRRIVWRSLIVIRALSAARKSIDAKSDPFFILLIFPTMMDGGGTKSQPMAEHILYLYSKNVTQIQK
jgi:hypothetical protein